MDMQIEGLDQVLKNLSDLEKKQIPFATSLALNETAKKIKSDLQREMKKVFNNPTPFTLKSVQITPARKNKLTARISLKEFAGKGTPASKYLKPQIHGGGRNLKRHEKLLQARGVLPRGKFTSPGRGIRKNKYGNLTGGMYTKIISDVRAFKEVGFLANRTTKKGKYFALKSGIYKRTGKRTIKSQLAFISKPKYRKRFDFYGVAIRTFRREYSRFFKQAFARAMDTAR